MQSRQRLGKARAEYIPTDGLVDQQRVDCARDARGIGLGREDGVVTLRNGIAKGEIAEAVRHGRYAGFALQGEVGDGHFVQRGQHDLQALWAAG